MSNSQNFTSTRYIKAFLDDTNPNQPRVKLNMSKKPFSPEQFTHIFMGILESYTASLLETNSNEAVYDHFNHAFGIFLAKLLPQEKIYERSEPHKTLKAIVDDTLAQPNDENTIRETEDNRLAAFLLARDILVTDAKMTEESADYLLGKRLGLVRPANGGGENSDSLDSEAKAE